MNNPSGYTVCRSCGSPGGGAHLHPEQCVKALRHDVASMQRTVVLVAQRLQGSEEGRAFQQSMLWRTVELLGGKVVMPDAAPPEPEGKSRVFNVKRSDSNDAFVLEAAFQPKTNSPAAEA